jgi:hypothetical protein
MTDHPEPVAIGDALKDHPLTKRLAERGIQITSTEADEHHHIETPEEAAERREKAHAGVRGRWERRRPAMYANAKMADLSPESVRGSGWSWDHHSLNLCLAGPVGTGKTHAAYAIANDWVDRGMVVEAWSVGDLLTALRPGHEDERADFWCRAADLLILDDLNATKVSEFSMEQITLLMDWRLSRMRRTIVTTNLTEDQLQEAWGERLMDRLRHRRTVKVLTGESRRRPEW